MRFVSGLGFGSTVPCVLALLAEWLPDRANARMMVLNAISIPAGGMIGAELSSWLVPEFGWPTIFIVGGAMTLATGLALFVFLPESIGYLVTRGESAARLTRLMRRMLPGAAALPADTRWILPKAGAAESGESPGGIFNRAYLRVNVGLWLCLFLNSVAVYSFANWVPTLLVDLHLPLETAIHGSLYYHTASIATTLLAALTVRRAGSRAVMLALALPGLAIDLVLGGVFRHLSSLDPSMALEVMIPLACVGGCIGGVQGTLYAVAANAYPTRWRGTGVGISSAAARLGGLTSSLVVSAILREGTSVVFFELIALASVGVVFAVILIDRHITPGAVTA